MRGAACCPRCWILVVTVVLILSVAYLTLWERKLIGWMQVRKGPNRVRLFGFLPGIGQPFADVIKLLIKEVVIPVAVEQGAVPPGAGHHADSGLRDLGRDADRARTSSSPTSMRACCTCCR